MQEKGRFSIKVKVVTFLIRFQFVKVGFVSQAPTFSLDLHFVFIPIIFFYIISFRQFF